MVPTQAESVQLSGLDRLREGLDAPSAIAPISEILAFDLVSAEVGKVVFEGTPTVSVYNPLGSVHGGWMATVLDSACGCVAMSVLAPDQTYVTLELKTMFHKGLKAGTPIRAVGSIVQAGRRVVFSSAELRGIDGTLYASATSTCLVIAI